MKSIQRTVAWLLMVALLAFGTAIAQDQEQPAQEQPAQEQPAEQPAEEQPAEQPAEEQPAEQPAEEQPAEEPAEGEGEVAGGAAAEQPETRTVEIRGEEVAPLGEIQVGQGRAYEDAQTETIEVEVLTGALSLNITTPDDQNANVDIVGPNGYYQRVEAGGAEPTIVDGLLPGVYSIAASDENLQVAHTVVEVTGGQVIEVQAALQALEAFEEGTFVGGAETAFPDDAYQAEEPVAIEDAEFGEVTVNTENEDTRFVITGPNGYSQEFSGSFTASDLVPGVYVIAGTRESGYEVEGSLTGAQIATSAVEVNVSQAISFVPVYDVVGAETQEAEAEVEEVEDVAGGGEAQETEQEQPAEEQPAEEQPAEEQPAEEQPVDEQQQTDPEDESGEGPIEEPVEEAVDSDEDGAQQDPAQEEEQQQ